MVRNQKIHLDANLAVACIRRDRPSRHEHPRGPADPDPDPDPVRSSLRAFAMDVIANIRTDLDAFSDVEQAVRMNHGYALIDAAIRTHAPELIATDAAFA